MAQQPTRWTFLERHRIKAGHSKLSLAIAVGKYASTIYRLEAGLRGASPELYQRLATELHVNIDDLIASAPKPPSQATATPKPAEVAS